MNDDADLLRRFARENDDASFRELVERRIGFVFAVNLRRLRDPHLAQDASQAVFIALARKAARVAEGPSVIGWLHRSSCYESRNLVRAQCNRLARETEAHRLGATGGDPGIAEQKARLETILDEVLDELSDSDRDALLARFFSNRSFAEIGAAMGRSENAARMRVDRALAKLRERLTRRGFDSPAAVLAGVLPTYAAASVPSGFATTVSTKALATFATAAAPAGFLASMSTMKITASVAAIAALGGIGYKLNHSDALERELSSLREQHAQTAGTIRHLEQQLAELKARPPAAVAETPTASSSATGSATAASTAESADTPGVTRKAPAGWFKNGSHPENYDVGVDHNEPWGGMPSAYAKSKPSAGSSGFGGMMQQTAADQYRGKRVRLTGWVKTKEANDAGGHLWLRVDGQTPGKVLAFDNMYGRAPKGTTDWQEHSIVLDVPSEASTLNFGFFVQGTGHMWVNALTIAPVGSDVPTTDARTTRPLPKAPVNLGFSPQ